MYGIELHLFDVYGKCRYCNYTIHGSYRNDLILTLRFISPNIACLSLSSASRGFVAYDWSYRPVCGPPVGETLGTVRYGFAGWFCPGITVYNVQNLRESL